MHTPVRVLRDDIENVPGTHRYLSYQELDRQDMVLAAARRVLAKHGRLAITIGSLAGALSLAPATIRRVFPDMDCLLSEILVRHLRALSEAICKIGIDDPDCVRKRRAAYIAATRTAMGNPSEGHVVLLRDRHTLPPDLLIQVEDMRRSLGSILAYGQETIALSLLDMPELDAAQIEACLATLAHPQLTAQPQPAEAAEALPEALPEAPPEANADIQPEITPARLPRPAYDDPPEIRDPFHPGPARQRHDPPPPPRRHKPDWSHPTLYDNAIRAMARAGPR